MDNSAVDLSAGGLHGMTYNAANELEFSSKKPTEADKPNRFLCDAKPVFVSRSARVENDIPGQMAQVKRFLIIFRNVLEPTNDRWHAVQVRSVEHTIPVMDNERVDVIADCTTRLIAVCPINCNHVRDATETNSNSFRPSGRQTTEERIENK